MPGLSTYTTVRIAGATSDKVVDVESHSVRLHRELPHSTIKISPEAGHMVHYTTAEEIAGAVDLMSERRELERVNSRTEPR